MKRAMALLAALACMLTLVCAGCAHYGNRLPETSPQSSGASAAPELPAGAPAPTVEPKKDDTRAAYAAYLGALTAAREDILAYDWQRGEIYDEELYEIRPAAAATPVVLADVWGDETPELIVASALSNGDFRYAAELRVYTWDDTGLRTLYETSVDGQVGGGGGYRLFQTGTDKGLWLYSADYGETTSETYSHFPTEGAMRPMLVCKHVNYPDEDETSGEWVAVDEYYRNNKICSAEEYADALPAEGEQAKGILMRNAFYYEYADDADKPEDAVAFPQGTAMTCDEAIGQLRLRLDVKTAAVDEAEFFASLPESFSFASGAGGWSSELFLSPDGTFTGDYHDSDMGDDGEEYPNGTIYVCSFSGAFGNVKRVDDYTYSMHLTRLDVEPTAKKEWIEDGVRYVASSPYGLENADEVMVYLPGSWVQGLPHEFVTWIAMPNAWSNEERPVTLPCYGLYNVADEEGWAGWKH